MPGQSSTSFLPKQMCGFFPGSFMKTLIGQDLGHPMRSNALAATDTKRAQGQRRLDFVQGSVDAIFAAVSGNDGFRRHLGGRGVGRETGHPEYALGRRTIRRVHSERDLLRLRRCPPGNLRVHRARGHPRSGRSRLDVCTGVDPGCHVSRESEGGPARRSQFQAKPAHVEGQHPTMTLGGPLSIP